MIKNRSESSSRAALLPQERRLTAGGGRSRTELVFHKED